MAKSVKPTLKPGEFLPAVTLSYKDVASLEFKELAGPYTVQLGAEYKSEESAWPGKTFRYALVDGKLVEFYAMVHATGRRADTVIERNEDALLQRAISMYIVNHAQPHLERERQKEAAKLFDRALDSTLEWTVVDGGPGHTITIMPLGIQLFLNEKDAKRTAKKRAIMHRIVELMTKHGL